MSETKTLTFEIGVEEIPAFDLDDAVRQLEKKVPGLLEKAHVPFESFMIYSSPRRLIVEVYEIPVATQAEVEIYKGPSVKIAFDEKGEPTKAALGFAKGKGVDVTSLSVEEVDGTRYVFAKREIPSQPVADLLPGVLNDIIHAISWPKSQRWGIYSETFARPVRWILALFGDDVIEFSYAGLSAARLTYGHRFLAPGPFEVAEAGGLIDILKDAYVIPSQTEREATIIEQIASIEQDTGLRAALPPKTLTEVINLTEYPTVMVGHFDEDFLSVPDEIIVDAMLMHQRYFPLYDDSDKLTNNFLIVSNGNPNCAETIVEGNERVVRARLYDAKFFYDEDLKKPLEDYVSHLSEVVFQEKLGTVLDKTNRIEKLVNYLAQQAHLPDLDTAEAVRAAHLAKADLVTNAVVEFTSLQGIMGSYYAQASGETPRVAQAISEHYRPKFAGDDLPETIVGQLVAFADKLDTICGLFAIDQKPTGSSDPFAIRRSAIGIINMLEEGLPVVLVPAIKESLSYFTEIEFNQDAVAKEVESFFIVRTKVMCKDAGFASDVIEAVLAGGVHEPVVLLERVKELASFQASAQETMQDLVLAFGRANNLHDEAEGTDLVEEALDEVEIALRDRIDVVKSDVDMMLAKTNYRGALEALASLRGPIDAFFEHALIMDEDPTKRHNRLALLNRFVGVFANVADFSLLAE